MPELPEVETVRRGAEPHLKGRTLRAVELARADLRWPMPKSALRDLVGRRCTAVERRAKYLLLRFSGPGNPIAIVHLGMTGRFAVQAIGRRTARPEWRKHEHWRMDFGDRLVRYTDARRFGRITYLTEAPLKQALTRFGADSLEISKEEFVKSAANGSAPSSIVLYYTGKEANLVMAPEGEPHELELMHGGEPLTADELGEDAQRTSDGRSVVRVDSPRMYNLVRNPGMKQKLLQLVTRKPGLECYAFTFTSCTAQDDPPW